MKTIFTVLLVSGMITGCSVFGSNQPTNASLAPPPPQKLNASNGAVVLPQIGNESQMTISESAAARANESQPTRFKVITENRGAGGAVNQVQVTNPTGGLPNYTLTPQPLPDDLNNNPDKISPPTWGFSW